MSASFSGGLPGAPARGRRNVNAGPGRDLRQHLHAISRFWEEVVACIVIGALIGILLSVRATPMYEVKSTFFASSQGAQQNQAVQADEFAQRRINSYIGVVKSERVAQVIKEVTGVDLTVKEIQDRVGASVAPETVLLTVRVTDSDPDRAKLIGAALTDNLDSEIAEIDKREGNTSVILNTISGPTLTPNPVSPNTKLNIAVGLLLGLLVGLVQAVIRQQLDQTFRTREQLADEAGYPVLGEIYYDPSAKKHPVLTEADRLSRRAESFRHLRTNLRFLGVGSPVAVLVVTSSQPREGKSLTSCNLAVTLASAGRKVLLIDADLRRPAVDRYLDIEGGAGLTNVLVDQADPHDLIQYWGPHGLAVLASGPLPPNPSELLGSLAMDKFLIEMREEFDITIIDTPPLGSVTDAAVVATKADGTIMVVRHGVARRDRVFAALDSLENVDARVYGTVLSASKAGKHAQSPYYYTSERT